MASSDSDVEFDDEWEEVQLPQPRVDAQTAAAAGSVYLHLSADDAEAHEADEQKGLKRSSSRSYTKQDREDALMVHRVHCLCLLAHSLLYDRAAADMELQAMLCSMLPIDMLEAANAAASSEDPLARNWLPKLLHWFHQTFAFSTRAVTQQPAAGLDGSSSGSRRGRTTAAASNDFLADFMGISDVPVQLQLLACVEARKGSSMQLSILLVALLRAVGFLVRSVWSLDALPFKPAAVEALQKGRSIRVTSAAAPVKRTATKAAAEAGAALGGGDAKRSAKRGQGGSAEAAGQSGGRATRGGMTGRGDGSKRGRSKTSNKGRGQQQQQQQQQQEEEGAAQDAGSDVVPCQRKRRGDAEFERELAMAMEATAAAVSRQLSSPSGTTTTSAAGGLNTSAAAAGATGAASQAGARLGAGSIGQSGKKHQSFAALIAKGVPATQLKRAAAAAAPPAGWLWQPQPGAFAAPKVWGEVYVGGSVTGRWLHVDALLGCVDQPEVVEAAVLRQQPLSYVVACQEGAPKDVTRRYAANFTVNLKWRDEPWWSATMTCLRSSTAHLPRALAAAVNDAAAAPAAGPGAPRDPATGPGSQSAAADASGLKAGLGAATRCKVAAAGDGDAAATAAPPLSKRRKLSPAQETTALSAVLAAAAPAGAAGGEGSGGGGGVESGANYEDDLSGAALRVAREDAELAARAALQTAGPPTTVEGFKAHPLYVLQRHITKYQAVRPGAVKLGLHKGEAFFAREDVQELHTTERWEREGRKVREEELSCPAKVVKKRKVPTGGASSGQRKASPGGWGAWARTTSTNNSQTQQSASSNQQPGTAPQQAPAGNADDAAAGDRAQDNDDSRQDHNMQQLYGLWQTVAFVRRAEDGKVPRNERGNVEVPPLAKSLPLGTSWIDAPNMAPICRSLGVDYAPALVGFEVQGGRMVPRIRGVVVCQEHEQAVIELHIQREAQRAAAEKDKQQREAMEGWRRLLQHMWTQLELTRKYSTAATAAAAQETSNTTAVRNGSSTVNTKDLIDDLNAAAGGILARQAGPASTEVTAGSREAGNRSGTGKQAARAGASSRASRTQQSKGLLSPFMAQHQSPATAITSMKEQAGGEHGLHAHEPQTDQVAAHEQKAVSDAHWAPQGVDVEEF